MHGGGGVNPAEVGTLSLEFHSLARATKRYTWEQSWQRSWAKFTISNHL